MTWEEVVFRLGVLFIISQIIISIMWILYLIHFRCGG